MESWRQKDITEEFVLCSQSFRDIYAEGESLRLVNELIKKDWNNGRIGLKQEPT
jgi:hypothetical protein